MLDVHPPHEAAHTWKDFFIHIATIVIGLIIAVGLEQSVEAVHHAHQRNELREALLQDNQKALRDNQDMERITLNRVQWLTARIDDVLTALHTNSHPHTIPLLPVSGRSFPDDPNWKAAKSSSLVEVLPQQDVKAFSEVETIINKLTKFLDASEDNTRRVAFEQRFRVSPSNDALDLSTATRDDLTQELALLSEDRSRALVSYAFTLYLRGCLTTVVHGERNLDRIEDAENSIEHEGLSHLNDRNPYRTAVQTPTLRTH